jgi:type II secretory pathway component GspD/PulD (secretin)
VVVDYVSATLGLNVIYDDSELNKRIALRVAEPVPKDSLLGLLRTVLRSRGLALVEAEQPGWLKIVPADKLPAEAGPLRHVLPDDTGQADLVTYVLPVRHADVSRVNTAIMPYLSKPGGTVLVVPESRLLLITDYARNVRRVVEIAGLLDVETGIPRIETIPVRHQDPSELAATVSRLLAERARLETPADMPPQVSLQANSLTGGIIAIGLAGQIEQARQLVEQFDVEVTRETQLYQPRYIAASRLRSLVEQMAPSAGLRMVADDASNTLVVTAPDAAHARIRELLGRFDTAPEFTATPLRFYKLLNRRADDVFATLGALLGEQIAEGGEDAELTDESPLRASGRNRPPAQPGVLQIPPRPPAETQADARLQPSGAVTSIQGEDFSLSLDEHTNSIIAIAPPELHQQIEQLINQLDKRRPQVLVEVTLVSVAADESLDLGVELEALDLGEPWNYLLFTSFGLSSIDPTTGQRRLAPMPGGTGVLLGPEEVPLIIQALANRGDTRVYSAPRILVDDNATGRIESVAESPFTSVNASDTVATTSFAGFAKAGTQLTIEPHIAEGDHLEINYTLTVSSFTGAGSGTIPPPRSSDTLSSTIRVPDGHTVIVGGLLTETLAESSSHVPLIGDVPVIGWLFGSRSESRSKVRLYAFIRPTILRDEGFEDLKYVSLEDLEAAGVDDGFPPTRHQYMR